MLDPQPFPTEGNPAHTRFWCVNFDKPEVLEHGLHEGFWAMQYQYRHGGHMYQEGKLRQIKRNWKTIIEVRAGDWLVAYRKKNNFYAIGEVIEPRHRAWQIKQPVHEDSMERTVAKHSHLFLDGIVRYTESPVFYEDFADPFVVAGGNSDQPEEWKYPQRIDVREWEDKCAGVQVDGLADAADFCRLALFEITPAFFEDVRSALRTENARRVPGGCAEGEDVLMGVNLIGPDGVPGVLHGKIAD